jgi:hypothetical protein
VLAVVAVVFAMGVVENRKQRDDARVRANRISDEQSVVPNTPPVRETV